jgi:hypothetical protein
MDGGFRRPTTASRTPLEVDWRRGDTGWAWLRQRQRRRSVWSRSATGCWWRDRDPTLSLAVNGRQNRRFRPSFTAGLKAAGAVTYVHSLIDPAAIRLLGPGDRRLPDEPFPPLDEAAPNARMPSFSGQDATPPA